VHVPSDNTSNDIKDIFYEEREHEFHQFPKYDIKILLGNFNVKIGREDIFKPTIKNNSSHKLSNDNGDTVAN
jgi:hypothetical protein